MAFAPGFKENPGTAGVFYGQDGRYVASAWMRKSDEWPGWPVCRERSDGVTLQRSKGPSLAHPASILTLVAFGELPHRRVCHNAC